MIITSSRVRTILLAASTLALLASGSSKKPAPQPPPPPPGPVKPQVRQLSTTGAGRALTRITDDPKAEEFPRLSADGSLLLFQAVVYSGAERASSVLTTINPQRTQARTLLTQANTRATFPEWHPSGESFYTTTDAMGGWSIVRSPAKGATSSMTVVVKKESADFLGATTISPDAKKIAFEAAMGGQWKICTQDLDGTNMTILGEGTDPRYADDGRILFSRLVGSYRQLFIMDGDGGSVTQLTNSDYNHTTPSWSPDGKWIVFVATPGNEPALFMMRPDGGDLTQVTAGGNHVGQPFWGVDGNIYFSAQDQGADSTDIWRVTPVTP